MKTLAAVAICSITLAISGCAADPSAQSSSSSTHALRAALGPNDALTCEGGYGTFGLIPAANGKVALLALTPTAKVYAVSRTLGSLDTSATGWTWTGPDSSIALGADMHGTWKSNAETLTVTCALAPNDAPAWRTASALVDYAAEIDGLADTVVDEMNGLDDSNNSSKNPGKTTVAKPPAYTVLVIETDHVDALKLGDPARESTGSLPGTDDNASALDESDSSYGAMAADYDLGGGEDYGEWFQGASDGISLSGDVTPALAGAKASFAGYENVKALSSVVASDSPSVITLTVGAWTFLLPDAFAK